MDVPIPTRHKPKTSLKSDVVEETVEKVEEIAENIKEASSIPVELSSISLDAPQASLEEKIKALEAKIHELEKPKFQAVPEQPPNVEEIDTFEKIKLAAADFRDSLFGNNEDSESDDEVPKKVHHFMGF